MTLAYKARRAFGDKAEDGFKEWVHKQAGWHVEPYGQGLMTEKTRGMMRETPFNGDSAILEQMLLDLEAEERKVYFDRLSFVPNLTRWMPDFVIAYRNSIICAPDAKASMRPSMNWAIEMSSVLGSKLHSKTGVQCVYAFPPTPGVIDYWSCASPDMIRERRIRVLDGRNTNGGSGTPFYLVPKLALDLPFKHVMTGIELNGEFRINSQHGSVLL